MKYIVLVCLLFCSIASAESVEELLGRAALPNDTVLNDVQNYLLARVPPLTVPNSRDAWEAESAELRQRFLADIVLRGVPDSWMEGDVQVEYIEDIETGHGYRIRKLRYEAIPGMWIPALLYEPQGETTNLPGVLNVNGHYDEGKVRDEEQIRCINLAKRGVVNIHPEWFRCGELTGVDNDHARGAYLDAVGVSMLAPFHIALSRAMDLLESHPRTDPARLAMTGLSGGGWQTAVFSAVDPRVSVIVPVAGHSAMAVRIANGSDIGDLEQVPMDMLTVADYTHLTALFAPRPALLIYNEKDNCCFPAPRTLPAIYDPIVPFYELYGAAADFQFHVNHDPGTHNYESDNRLQFYQFVDDYLVPEEDWPLEELHTADEVLPVEQTNVGIPEGNATIVGTAIRLARELKRPAIPEAGSGEFAKWQRDQRGELRRLLSYNSVNLLQTKTELASEGGTLTAAYTLESVDWSIAAAGVLPPEADGSEVHIVMNEDGFTGAEDLVSSLVREGKQAVAVAPLFQEGTSPIPGNDWQYAMLINATGERTLALQAAQLAAVCAWFKSAKGVKSVTVHGKGIESGMITLTAAALNPGLIDRVVTREMPDSIIDVMEDRGRYNRTPSIFVFGLLKHFDFAELRAMAS